MAWVSRNKGNLSGYWSRRINALTVWFTGCRALTMMRYHYCISHADV
jgi:Txe/YoeB family toxin of Txe-Axe toxin-antitoxin module